jgi:hypothetical protein
MERGCKLIWLAILAYRLLYQRAGQDLSRN